MALINSAADLMTAPSLDAQVYMMAFMRGLRGEQAWAVVNAAQAKHGESPCRSVEELECVTAEAVRACPEPGMKVEQTMERISEVLMVRDEKGWWTHPGMPAFEEGEEEKFRRWVVEHELEVKYESLEYEDPDHPAYVEYFERGGTDVSTWNPMWPAGEGWFPLSIHDSEDGPVFWWARSIRATANAF